jgi:hypothetical protein
VRIYVTNNLPEGTSIHWHGLLVQDVHRDFIENTKQRFVAGRIQYRHINRHLLVKSIESGKENNCSVSNKKTVNPATATKTGVTPHICAVVP